LSARLAAVGLLLLSACFEVSPNSPTATTPSPVVVPPVVSVTVEYRQPFQCQDTVSAARCGDPVVFSASWMQPGSGLILTGDPANHVFRGTAVDVPVNFPPRDTPYTVRVFDPFFVDGPSQGFTAERLVIGGAFLTQIASPGSPAEHGLVFIDANGVAHEPF
jgi:hypothetical protein